MKGMKRMAGLPAVMAAGAAAAAAGAAWLAARKRGRERERELERCGNKYHEYFLLLGRWMAAWQEGKSIPGFLKEEGVREAAIYGMGQIADRLAEELERGGIRVAYGIDRDVCCTNGRIADIYSPDEELPRVDAIIITPFLSAGEIRKGLEAGCPCRIYPIDEIVYSL